MCEMLTLKADLYGREVGEGPHPALKEAKL